MVVDEVKLLAISSSVTHVVPLTILPWLILEKLRLPALAVHDVRQISIMGWISGLMYR